VTLQGKFAYTFKPLMNATDAANLLAQVFGAMVTLRQESVRAGSFALDCPLCLLAYNGC